MHGLYSAPGWGLIFSVHTPHTCWYETSLHRRGAGLNGKKKSAMKRKVLLYDIYDGDDGATNGE